MPLNKLDNFLKNVEGRILYVSPSDLDASDAMSNQGNSQATPFKTVQRALIESARFSYVQGNNNDITEKTTILLMPGEHIIDNRPGYKIKKSGNKPPDIYKKNEHDFLNLVNRNDIDAVYIATPWEWHHEMAVAAMKQGKHVGVECPAALTVNDLWDLVNVSEKENKHCMLMENVCYRRDVMAVLNMVREGVFGELLHCQGGYQHDLREVKFNDGKQPYGGGLEFNDKGYSESKWRTQHSIDRNGDLYPTHGIGPIHTMLDINRGNRFVHMTSTASQSRGLNKHIIDQGGLNHRNAGIKFKLGDIVTSVIKCSNGQTIVLSHDTSSPRPYSLNFRIQGTEGLWMVDNNSIYIQGLSKEEHRWESDEDYLKQYDHPLWKKFEKSAAGSGHGGMDFFILNAFVEPLKSCLLYTSPSPRDS